jgi:hypothetical protein
LLGPGEPGALQIADARAALQSVVTVAFLCGLETPGPIVFIVFPLEVIAAVDVRNEGPAIKALTLVVCGIASFHAVSLNNEVSKIKTAVPVTHGLPAANHGVVLIGEVAKGSARSVGSIFVDVTRLAARIREVIVVGGNRVISSPRFMAATDAVVVDQPSGNTRALRGAGRGERELG